MLERDFRSQGMLGNNDIIEREKKQDIFSENIFGGITGNMLGKMLNSAMKMLEKEMNEFEKQNISNNPNFQLYINGKKVNPNNIKVIKKPMQENFIQENTREENQEIPKYSLSKEKIKKFSSLPREEPAIDMKRFSDEIVYELDVPGVKSLNDIIITKLENSIEIKALGKDKVYKKIIPVNLPIKKYGLLKDKLILRLYTNTSNL